MPDNTEISETTVRDRAGPRRNRVGKSDAPITKQVAVMMPFGGDDDTRKRRFVLEFMRIRYLIENNTTVVNEKIQKRIRYKCMAFRARVGDIPRDGMQIVAKTDILVGLVSERNVNVIYELAVRNLLKDEMFLILKGKHNLLPVYLRNMPYLLYDGGRNAAVAKLMDDISVDEQVLLDFDDDIPSKLRKEIKECDARFLKDLNKTLNTIENKCPKRQSYILDLVQDLDPGLLLGTWATYAPYSVVQIRWKEKTGDRRYVLDDMDGPPLVYSGNDQFRYLFNIVAPKIPDPNGPDPLTQIELLTRIAPFPRKGNVEVFERDQQRLLNSIILGDGFDQAQVPLEITAYHPRDGYKNKVLLPCMVGKRTVGDNNSAPHTTYLLIVFIEDFWPEAYKQKRASRQAKKEKKASGKPKKRKTASGKAKK